MVVQLPNHVTDNHQDGRNELTMLPAMPSVVIPAYLTYLANKVGEWLLDGKMSTVNKTVPVLMLSGRIVLFQGVQLCLCVDWEELSVPNILYQCWGCESPSDSSG